MEAVPSVVVAMVNGCAGMEAGTRDGIASGLICSAGNWWKQWSSRTDALLPEGGLPCACHDCLM